MPPMTLGADYDVWLRHGLLYGGDWRGYRLAWGHLGGLPGERKPAHGWLPWQLNPLVPHDPTQGWWAQRRWRFQLVCAVGVVGVNGRLPSDSASRPPSVMRAEIQAYAATTAMQLQDADGATYNVRIIGYREEVVEPYDAAHNLEGAWLVEIDLCELP